MSSCCREETSAGSAARGAGFSGYPEIDIPHGTGVAVQDISYEALAARQAIEEGATLYKLGTVEKNIGGSQAQFWSLENPILNPNYANDYGLPFNTTPDFLQTGVLKPGANFITRPAPGLGINNGGMIEAVIEENGVLLQGYHYSPGGF